ncbi:8519_t:CDS:1 [Racocetra fulgida]|uniref:8519_t:CDS:1 n=1 Tax=Racocetra fulgida TaxID=60492 RepID=A0A9N9A983_9GLOM|nr:8519_t:CDS:1 [Racocetra fulgida]
MYNRAGRINVGKRDKEGDLKNDYNIQKFKDLPFRIKVETLPTEENLARIFFLKKDKEEEIPIPDGITCVDVTFKNNIAKDPVVYGANWFLVTHPYKYNIYYNPENKKCTRKNKIYSLNPGKDYTIYNYRKTDEVLEDEECKRMIRKSKMLDESIKSITGLPLSDGEMGDDDDESDE